MSGQRAKRIENSLAAWRTFGPRLRDSSKVFAFFEVWNLIVILVSLGGFGGADAAVVKGETEGMDGRPGPLETADRRLT